MRKMSLYNWFRKIFICDEISGDAVNAGVGDSERIVRFLLSPLHFKKDGKLRSNAFNPTPNTDEVSVNRLEIIPIARTKEIAKAMVASRSGNNKYCGFAMHTKLSAIECDAKDVVSDPIDGNKAHAEIKMGIVRKDLEIPAEITEIKDKLAEKSKLLLDPNPEEDGWNGPAPIYS